MNNRINGLKYQIKGKEPAFDIKVCFSTFVFFLLFFVPVQSALISVDSYDYAISESVTIKGSGFSSNEPIVIEIIQSEYGGLFDLTITVTTDAFGEFSLNWLIPDEDLNGVNLTAIAIGQLSGLEASTTFMSGNSRLYLSLEPSQPLCPDTLNSDDSIKVFAGLYQNCQGVEVPLPGRKIYFFINQGNCGVSVGQIAADSAITGDDGVASIVVRDLSSEFDLTNNPTIRAKFFGENKPAPNEPPNSACTSDGRDNISASNDCIEIETVDSCPSDLMFVQTILGSIDVYSMKTIDLDRNNYTDIIYCGTSNTPGLFVTLAIDNQGFYPPTPCLDIYNAAISVDFINSDSLPDIVAKTADETYVLLNGGQGELCDSWVILSPNSTNRLTTNLQRTAVSDIPVVVTEYFNQDSHLDMFVGPSSVLLGNGEGDFTESGVFPVAAFSATAGDFNNDGWQDLLATDIDSAYILLNDGDGNFTVSNSIFVDTGYVSVPIDIAVADMDVDCHRDFLVPVPNVDSSGQSLLYIGFGDGFGGVGQIVVINIDGVVHDVLVVDMDRDHILDIVVSNGTKKRVEIYRGNGDRTFDGMEYFSVASAGDAPFSLATADFDRDGQPDFISGSYDNGNLLLSTNNLEDLPVLADEMAVTAYTNTTIRVTNPYDFQTSEQSQTIAGGAIWSLDVDGDDTLDVQVLDYNLVQGEYLLTFYLQPEFEDDSGSVIQPLSSSVRIDGSQQATIFNNYSYSGSSKSGSYSHGCYPDSIKFVYLIGEDSSLYYPFNGIQTSSSQPQFYWGGLLPGKSGAADRVHLQVDRTLDFLDPIIDDSDLVSASFTPCSTLFEIGEVYYWHVRYDDGSGWSEFSNTFAAYIGGNCCFDMRGDLNTDGLNGNIVDLTFAVDYIFRGGDCMQCPEEADITKDGHFNIFDLTFLIDYIFRFGPSPGMCY